jgi:septal ring factor EnvC (AmiA/AmiB activator)
MRFNVKLHTIVLLICFISFGPADIFAQSKKKLKERIQHKQSEIENANNLLEETKESKQSSLYRLSILQKRVSLRNELINQLNQQVHNLDSKIEDHKRQINQLEKNIKKLKKNYEKIIYHAYLNNKGFDKLMFILSAQSFNQAYKRFKYLNQLAKYRRNQAQQIRIQKEKQELKLQELRNLRSRKEDILAQKVGEKQKLKREQIQVNRQVSSLKEKESEIRQQIEEKRRIIAQLEKEIQKIIEEERKRTELWKNLSENQRKITKAFASNKGKHLWPISNGIITRDFGKNEHPVLKGIETYNNGIDISASKNSKVKCIFEGIARKVVSIPGANLTVIVRHGNYLSVYSNLVNVNVRPGEKISRGEVIGEVYQNQSTKENVLHLEIYRENERLNPEEWLN